MGCLRTTRPPGLCAFSSCYHLASSFLALPQSNRGDSNHHCSNEGTRSLSDEAHPGSQLIPLFSTLLPPRHSFLRPLTGFPYSAPPPWPDLLSLLVKLLSKPALPCQPSPCCPFWEPGGHSRLPSHHRQQCPSLRAQQPWLMNSPPETLQEQSTSCVSPPTHPVHSPTANPETVAPPPPPSQPPPPPFLLTQAISPSFWLRFDLISHLQLSPFRSTRAGTTAIFLRHKSD